MQEFMHKMLGPALTSKKGVVILLLIYLVALGGGGYQMTNMKIDFKQSYVINDQAEIHQFIDREEKYYTTGPFVTIYTDGEMDFSKEEPQLELKQFIDDILVCKDCENEWIIKETFSSWYMQFIAYSITNKCTDSFDFQKQIVKPDRFM